MIKLLKEKINKGEYDKALSLINKMNQEDLFLTLKKLAYTDGIAAYAFICFLISQNNQAVYHAIAAHLLALPLCSYKGAYSAGFFHAKEAARLDPADISNKELLLLFNRIPEHLLGKDEAIEIAKNILQKKPDSYAAQEVLLDYGVKL